MSQYNRDKNPFNWRSEISTDIDAIRRELDQLRFIRFPQANENRDIRWAMTVGTVPSTYPNSDANTFPIRFLDSHFTKTAGLRTLEYFNRSTDPVTIAHAATGQYIPPSLPLPVFWQRGLGGEGKGEWWFLDPPRLYVVELTEELTYRGSAEAEIHLPDNLFALAASGITITVRDVLLGAGETLPAGSRLLAHWYLTPYPHWIVDIGTPRPVEIVEVYHSSATAGDIVEANSAGYHPGRIRTYNGTATYDVGDDIWIQFVDGFDGHDAATDDGAVLACHNEYYGPAKHAGTWDLVENEGEEDETHDERLVYVVESSERQFLCKADSSISKGSSGTVSLYHSHDETDSGINRTAKALFAAISTSKWCIYHRIAGVWYVSKAEC